MIETPGKRLKAARLERKLSVEDITVMTKMRPSIIVALEADDYSEFPSITHTRSFLLLYGKHLHVDVQDAMSSLTTPAKMGIENYQYLNVERHEDTNYRTQRRRTNVGNPRNGEAAPRNLGMIVGVIAFIFFAIYLVINLQRLNLASATKAADATVAREAAAPTPAGRSEPMPTPDRLRSPTPLPEPSSTSFYTPTLDSRRPIRPRPSPRF